MWTIIEHDYGLNAKLVEVIVGLLYISAISYKTVAMTRELWLAHVDVHRPSDLASVVPAVPAEDRPRKSVRCLKYDEIV